MTLAPQQEGRIAKSDEQLHTLGRCEDRKVASVRRDVGDRDGESLEEAGSTFRTSQHNLGQNGQRTGKSGLMPGVVAIAQIHCRGDVVISRVQSET